MFEVATTSLRQFASDKPAALRNGPAPFLSLRGAHLADKPLPALIASTHT